MFWNVKNFAVGVTKRTRIPPSDVSRVHDFLVSDQVANLGKSFSTNITRILVLVLVVNSPYVTGQVSHNCTTHVASVLNTLMLHLHVCLHLRFAAATKTTHFTLERSFLVVALFNVLPQLANLFSTLVTFELGITWPFLVDVHKS